MVMMANGPEKETVRCKVKSVGDCLHAYRAVTVDIVCIYAEIAYLAMFYCVSPWLGRPKMSIYYYLCGSIHALTS